jgi:hypothetical protein
MVAALVGSLLLVTVVVLAIECSGYGDTPTPALTHEQQVDAWATEVAREILQRSDYCSVVDAGYTLRFVADPALVPEIPASERDAVYASVRGKLVALCS